MSEIDSHAAAAARQQLDAHVRDIVQWHFSPETGCPFWLDWAGKAGWNPAAEVKCFGCLQKFPHFQDEWLRDLQPEVWVPKKFKGRPFNIFETGGTTGMPKQRIGWRVADGWADRPAAPAPGHRAPGQFPRQFLLLH
jgi:phenylacetate-coenzyme A ligase PaaK-like adenylate-forming protein